MAERGFLLPDEPLFLVDKSLRPRRSSHQSSESNARSYLTDDLKIVKVGTASRTTHARDANNVSTAPIPSPGRHEFQFVAATEPGGRQNRSARRAVRQHARKYDSKYLKSDKETSQRAQSRARTSISPRTEKDAEEDTSTADLAVTYPVPSSTSLLYGFHQGQDPTGLEQFIHYYHSNISRSSFPLERHVALKVNPVQGVCFPLALSDGFFLKVILLISAIHHSYVTGKQEPKETNALAHRVLNELRARIADSSVTDATILAVSCIALIENVMGNHKSWSVHNSGIFEMVRNRGGIQTFDTGIRWKIYRCDVVGAVDSIGKPLLPRPHIEKMIDLIDSEVEAIPDYMFNQLFGDTGVSLSIQRTFWDIRIILDMIWRGIGTNKPLNFFTFDSRCVHIQYSLLQEETHDSLSECCRIAGLVFMNTMTMLTPFLRSKSINISKKLRLAFETMPAQPLNRRLTLWVSFMGALISLNTDDHDWFLERLHALVREHNLETWEATKKELSNVLWLEPLHEESGFGIWEELQCLIAPIALDERGELLRDRGRY